MLLVLPQPLFEQVDGKCMDEWGLPTAGNLFYQVNAPKTEVVAELPRTARGMKFKEPVVMRSRFRFKGGITTIPDLMGSKPSAAAERWRDLLTGDSSGNWAAGHVINQDFGGTGHLTKAYMGPIESPVSRKRWLVDANPSDYPNIVPMTVSGNSIYKQEVEIPIETAVESVGKGGHLCVEITFDYDKKPGVPNKAKVRFLMKPAGKNWTGPTKPESVTLPFGFE